MPASFAHRNLVKKLNLTPKYVVKRNDHRVADFPSRQHNLRGTVLSRAANRGLPSDVIHAAFSRSALPRTFPCKNPTLYPDSEFWKEDGRCEETEKCQGINVAGEEAKGGEADPADREAQEKITFGEERCVGRGKRGKGHEKKYRRTGRCSSKGQK